MSPDDPIYSDQEEDEKIKAFLVANPEFHRVEFESDEVVFYFHDSEEPWTPEELVPESPTRQVMEQLRWDLGYKL